MNASFRSTELAAYTAHADMESHGSTSTGLTCKRVGPGKNLALSPLLQRRERTAADMAYCPFPAQCARAVTCSAHS